MRTDLQMRTQERLELLELLQVKHGSLLYEVVWLEHVTHLHREGKFAACVRVRQLFDLNMAGIRIETLT